MILFDVDGFVGKIIKWPEESENYGRLRYDYFVNMCGWKIPTADKEHKLDWDEFDLSAVHVGLYHSNELIGYCRLLLSNDQSGILLQSSFFSELVPHKDWAPEKDSAEVSRFCLEKDYQPGGLFGIRPFLLLAKAAYQVAVQYCVERIYVVTTGEDKKRKTNVLKFYQHFFPFQIISGPVFYEDDVETYSITISIEQTREALKKLSLT